MRILFEHAGRPSLSKGFVLESFDFSCACIKLYIEICLAKPNQKTRKGTFHPGKVVRKAPFL